MVVDCDDSDERGNAWREWGDASTGKRRKEAQVLENAVLLPANYKIRMIHIIR
jgi:hypothetical protein